MMEAILAPPRSKTLLVQVHPEPPARLRLDDWTPWINTSDRYQTVSMAAHKFARHRGLLSGDKMTVYVYHAWTTDPKHESGQPMCVLCSECIVSKD